MFDPLSITGKPYDCNQFINQLQAYNTWVGNEANLDLIRFIQESGNYYWQGLAIPDSSLLPSIQTPTNGIGANKTVNGVAVIPPGTYVTSITEYHSQPDGFRFKLYDKGTKASIYYGDYIKNSLDMSSMNVPVIYGNPPSDPGVNSDTPLGPAYLLSPFIITKPGVLGWEIVNGSSSTNVIQVMLACAVPINARSISHMVVNKSGR